MKTTTALLAALLLICLHNPLSAQTENKGQLWYCYEETVKPGEVDAYLELSKEMLGLCKQNNFPFPIYTWSSGTFKFLLWSPINSLDDIDKIERTWKMITDKWGQEKYRVFNNTKIKNFSYTVRGLPELHFIPEHPRYTMEEATYVEWNQLHIIPGQMDEVKGVIKKMIALSKSKNYDDPWYYFEGSLGFETPVLIAIRFAKNKVDAFEQDDRFAEVFGDDFHNLRNQALDHMFTRENKEFWWLKDMTYEPGN